MTGAGKGLSLLALLLAAVAVMSTAAWMVAPGRSEAQSGSMDNCPQAGKWAIAVWDGPSGTAAADALATCGAGAVDAAYYLDPQTGGWLGWLAGQSDISNLATLDDKQGVLALGGTGAVAAAGGERLAAAQAAGQLQNCPSAGKWSIAVWDGPSGTAAADALATCGAGAVDVAYYLDPQTGGWLGWLAGRPDISNLPPLNDRQGVLVLGSAASPTPTPSPSPTPTPSPSPTPTPPSGSSGPVAGATYVGKTSQDWPMEFDVTGDGLGIGRVKYGFNGLLYGEPCVGSMETIFGTPPTIVDNSFTIGRTDYDMTGRFDSPTTASGELEVHIPDRIADPGCFSEPLTWTASVQ